MKRNLVVLIFLIWHHLAYIPPALAQGIPVTVRLRTVDGSPIPQEQVQLIHIPDGTVQTGVTNSDGRARFFLERGIYEVHFSTALDAVSRLAVSEAGLSSFGVTVGNTAIEYSFVLNTDRHVYFDQTPDSESASPIIPTLEELHFHYGALPPTATPQIATFATSTRQVDSTIHTEESEPTPPQKPWPLFAFAGGLLVTYEVWQRWHKHKGEEVNEERRT